MSRDILPLRLGADTLWSRHSAQLFERALSIREWSSSGRVAYFVPACRIAKKHMSSLATNQARTLKKEQSVRGNSNTNSLSTLCRLGNSERPMEFDEQADWTT